MATPRSYPTRTVVGWRTEKRGGQEYYVAYRLSCGHWQEMRRPRVRPARTVFCETCHGNRRDQRSIVKQTIAKRRLREVARGVLDRARENAAAFDGFVSFLGAVNGLLSFRLAPRDPAWPARLEQAKATVHDAACRMGLYEDPAERDD